MSKQTEQLILYAVIALLAFRFLSSVATSTQTAPVYSAGTSFDLGGDISDAFGIASDFD